MLNITKNIEGKKAVYALEGRLDTVTSPELEEDLKVSVEGIDDLVLDLSKLDYISSAGLRVFLSVFKIMSKQGEMKLINVNSTVKEILDVTGFSDILKIE